MYAGKVADANEAWYGHRRFAPISAGDYAVNSRISGDGRNAADEPPEPFRPKREAQ